jgi:hypothetical protein
MGFNGINFNGLKILESLYLVVPDGEQIVKRTWRQRLLSWPWRPWVSTTHIAKYKPDQNLYKIGEDSIVGHPVTIAKLAGWNLYKITHGIK